MWNNLEDNELIKASKQGDADAFGALYERYAQNVFRYVFSHTDNRLDAEDLTEEVFLRTWRSLRNYQERGVPFLAFLFRVARNAIIDYYRHAERSDHNELEEIPYIRDMSPSPIDVVVANAERQELRLVLSQLREDYRNVLVLRFLLGLTPKETAEVMGRSLGTVRVLQHRALNALRKLIGPGGLPGHE